MKWFINLSIRTKVLLGFGVMWLFLALVAVVAYHGHEEIRLSVLELHDTHFQIGLDLRQIRSDNNFVQARMLEMMITPNNAGQEKIEKTLREREKQIDKLIEGLVKIDTAPDCLAGYRQLQEMLAELRLIQEKQISLIHAGKVDDALQLEFSGKNELVEKIRENARAHGDRASVEIGQQLATDMAEARSSELLFAFCAAVALLFGVLMTVLMNKTIVQPLAAISNIASRIASRDDLSVEFPVSERRDEVGTLTQALRTMIGNIRTATTDISEARRLEAELRTSSFYARNLIEASLDPLVTINAEGKITDVNKTTEQVTGVARAHLIGSDFSNYFTEPEKAREGYRKVFTEGVVRDYPLTIRHGSGRTTDVLYNASVYKNEVGQVQGVFAAARDITERKKMDEELRGYREQLEEMVKKRTAELADVLKEVKATVNVLAGASTEILASTTQVATGTAETSTAISETTTTVEEVRQAAQLSSQKAKNVADSAQLVSQVGQTGQKAVEEVVAGMEHIRAQMESIAATIVRLSEQTQSIGGIIAAVTDIADQSNLLAVNAAIEATRAGEQGKAFGVVAQEIKSLAEQSKQATLQVRSILSDVQRATSAAVMATEQGSKSVEVGVRQSAQAGEAIMKLAESSAQAVQTAVQIVASSQQQVVGMDQIGLAMESINKAGAQTAASTTQVETAARSLHEMGQKLKSLVELFKG